MRLALALALLVAAVAIASVVLDRRVDHMGYDVPRSERKTTADQSYSGALSPSYALTSSNTGSGTPGTVVYATTATTGGPGVVCTMISGVVCTTISGTGAAR